MQDITIAVVAYGTHYEILRRCIDSIVAHTSKPYSIILCLNEVGFASHKYVYDNRASIDTVIDSSKNICIEGAITLALHACRTPWMVRMDDDSWICKPGWLDILRKEIEQLPASAGALGRLHRFGAYSDSIPGQGYVSRMWVRQQPWHNPKQDKIMYDPPIGVSGGFCALKVEACMDVEYPTDNYSAFEDDVILSLMLRMNGYTLHDSDLISKHAMGSDVRFPCDSPYIAIGDAPSRTDRKSIRPKWKDL